MLRNYIAAYIMKHLKGLKLINFFLSLLPLLWAISLYTLFYFAKSNGIIEIKGNFIPPKIYYGYKITEALLIIMFISLIPNFFLMAVLAYMKYKNKIKITGLFIVYIIGIIALIYVARIDHPKAVLWFFD